MMYNTLALDWKTVIYWSVLLWNKLILTGTGLVYCDLKNRGYHWKQNENKQFVNWNGNDGEHSEANRKGWMAWWKERWVEVKREKLNCHAIPPLLTILESQWSLELSFISSHYSTFFYWSVTLLAAVSPTMALKLDGLGSVKRYCSGRPAALILSGQ